MSANQGVIGYVLVDGTGTPVLSDVWETEEGAEDALAYGLSDPDHDGADTCPVAVRPYLSITSRRAAAVGDIVVCAGQGHVRGVGGTAPSRRHADQRQLLRHPRPPTEPVDTADEHGIFTALTWTAP